MTNFQRVISNIENYKYTKEEQEWVDEYIGLPLTEKQKYGMHCRFHIHLTPDEKGEGFDKAKKKMGEARKGHHWKLVDGKRVWY